MPVKAAIEMSQYHLNDEERIWKFVLETHHRGDKKCGESRGMQCSYMALMSVGWNLLKTISRYLDGISLNGNLLFESINKLR